MQLPVFLSFKSTAPSKQLSLQEIAEIIKNNAELKSITLRYRKYLGVWTKKMLAEDKTKLMQVAIHCTMEEGKRLDDCKKLTGLLFLDFDQHGKQTLEEEKLKAIFCKMANDPHTVLATTSVSGFGYHVIARYECPKEMMPLQPSNSDTKEQFRSRFIFSHIYKHVADYYTQLTGMEMDMQCANFTQLMALSYDPDVVLREEAEPFVLTLEQLGLDDKGDIIYKGGRHVKSRTKNKTVKTTTLKVPDELDLALHMARQTIERQGAQWTSGHHNDYLTRLSGELNRYGCEEEATAQLLNDVFGAEYTDMQPSVVMRSVYRNRTDEFGTKSLPTGKNGVTSRIKYFLTKMDVKVRRLVLSGRLELYHEASVDDYGTEHDGRWCEMTDADLNSLYCQLEEKVPGLYKTMLVTVLQSDFTPLYNPMSDYFRSLPAWDGHDYILDLAQQVHIQDPEEWEYFHLCLRRWLVAMVATWNSQDKTKDKRKMNQQCLILCGEQGIYKTTWLNRLLPPEFEQFVSQQDMSRPLDKDEVLRASQYAMVILDEMHGLNARELDKLKSLLTTEATSERESYGTFKQHRQRLATYCGSSNHRYLLTDITGNRRWMPFWVDSIDSPFEHPLPYEQLYAQLHHLYVTGYRFWLDKKDIEALEWHNEHYRILSPEEELLMVYYARPDDPLCYGYKREEKHLTASEILSHLTIMGSLRKNIGVTQMAMILKKLGFQSGRDRTSRYWVVHERSMEEVQAVAKKRE